MSGLAAALRLAALVGLMMAVAARTEAADPEPVQAAVELYVNTVDKGTALVAFAGEHVLIATAALDKAGVRVAGGTRQVIAGNSFVDLASLAPPIQFRYDESNISLLLTVDPHLLGTSEFNLQRTGAPAAASHAEAPSAFLNYALNSVTTGSTTTASLFTEQGASVRGLFFDDGLTIASNGTVTRSNTSVIADNRDRLTRLTLGDVQTAGATLGGPVSLGGIGYSRNFAINPYFLPFPTQRFSGIVNTPSTADVYVNGQLVKTIDLPPGSFDLLNIPGVSGAGATRVVIRNAFGQTQELSAPYYQSAQLLSQGLSSFSYEAGAMRVLAPSGFGEYGMPAFAAAHDYGFTDRVTAGGFFQGDRQLAVGGPDLTVALPVGLLSFAGAASGGEAPFGWSGTAQYDYQTSLYNLGVNATYTSARYATLSLTPDQDRARWQVGAFAGVTIGRWDALVQATPSRYRDSGRNDQASIRIDNRLTELLSASLTLGQSRLPHATPDTSILLGLTYSFGTNSIANVSVGTSHEGPQATAQASRSLPLGPGYGYLVQAQAGANPVDEADLQYQTTFGSYEADTSHSAGVNTERLSASGSLVAIGGDVKPSLPLNNAYALIRVPGVPNVTGYLSNQEVGRTDANGDLLVPNLLSYYGNRVEIDDQDVPIDYSIQSAEQVVIPSYRGGAVVEFPVKRFRAYEGTLVVKTQKGSIVPAYGDIAVTAAGKTYDSPIGEHGEFYLEGLPAGAYPALITVTGTRCAFTFRAPPLSGGVAQMGELACDAR
jgi:outer membrane usher protein